MTFTQGRLVLVYYDTRLDHTVRYRRATPLLDANPWRPWFLGPAYTVDANGVLSPDFLRWTTDPYKTALAFFTDAVPDTCREHLSKSGVEIVIA
jgi:hypothetical protein